jgi:hypothetical protein
VTLRNNINNRIYSAGNGTLINQETIQGTGQIGVGQTTITNSGVIDANVSSTLFIQPGAGGVTNTGTLEATAGGRLDLRGTYANTGGTINASGTSSVVALDGAVIHGGTLTSSSNGLIESINRATLNGVTIGAGTHYVTPNNTITVLQATIINNGTIALNAGLNNTDLQISGPVTLTGTATLNLANNPNNRIYALNGSDVLTNKGTIQGAGQLGVGRMGLVNAGTINANQSAGILLWTNSKGLNNTGTLQTAAGDTMHVTGGPFTNFSGTTLTGGSYVVAGTLKIDELGNTGGEIVTDAARITLVSSSAKFIDAAGKNALSKLATITSAGAFTISGTGDTYTTASNFTNNGTLNVGSGSKFDVNGNLTNFSGTTLTGGTYNVTGTLQFNGANIVTNAARITLTGTTAKIVNQTGTTGALANFATNAAAGSFTLASSRNFTTAGNFSNAGTVKVSRGSTFTVASTHNYTQTAGTTTDDGTMALSSGGAFTFNGGSVFGNGGSFSGNVTSGGTFNIGDAVKTAGKLAITGTYVQTPAGALNIDIGGLTPGTLFDQLNVSGAANLAGTLNLDLINKFTPTIGQTFDIMNFKSETGKFTTINGTSINANEHFSVVVNPTNVTLDVVSGALLSPAAMFGSTSISGTPTPEPSSLLLLSSGTLAGVAAYRRKPRTR